MNCEHGVNAKYCRACKKVAEKKRESGGLSEYQISNWRTALLPMIGPYAIFMPVTEIIKFKDMMQDKIIKFAEETTDETVG